MTQPDWIAGEWAQGHLRLWQMAADDTVLAQMAPAPGRDAAEALARLLPELAPGVPVLISGAADLPFPAVPCKPPVMARARDGAGGLHLLPGVAQARPADILEGEETRVAGFLALNPRFDGVVCLPGAQSRWVHVSAGEIVSFRSFLTGTLGRLLAAPEALGPALGTGWDEAAFLEAVDQAMGRPAGFAGDLSAILAESRLHDLSPAVALARLWGLLIGMELAAAKPYWLGQSVAILDEGETAARYRAALAAQGVPAVLADGARMALEGLKRARREAKP
ncbi:2-dehydro-3-deoxygalactonokinase [Salipiger sp. P9]|uniref:2-dehydro-3-deoxygalactonokinase n=1 Tax=Salipiger pentaromativorans TaxID=2943193 RepID=UPI0021585747|nr:2-dehydro-3-deoxygalactonokinase [Salipiger pentaromativorans]MCR8550341.1 2-dehydro-3-deoxygalactonokinase [Salipiger pentaromativorans]